VVNNNKTAPEAKVVEVPPPATAALQSQGAAAETGSKLTSGIAAEQEKQVAATQVAQGDITEKGEEAGGPVLRNEASKANKEAGATAAAAPPNMGASNNIVPQKSRSWKKSTTNAGATGTEEQQQQEKETAGAASGTGSTTGGNPAPELPGVQFLKRLFGLNK
jgi:hypothetical protein